MLSRERERERERESICVQICRGQARPVMLTENVYQHNFEVIDYQNCPSTNKSNDTQLFN